MTKNKSALFILFLLAAGAIYFYLYKDSFGSKGIQIFHRSTSSRPMSRPRGRSPSPPSPIQFGLNKSFRLTEVKVVPVGDILTSKYPHPIWHLVSDSNSAPVKSFAYGDRIPGMRLNVKGVPPEPLEPKVPYRLIVEAGSIHAEHDFQIQQAQ